MNQHLLSTLRHGKQKVLLTSYSGLNIQLLKGDRLAELKACLPWKPGEKNTCLGGSTHLILK